jgi:hypothetical protein
LLTPKTQKTKADGRVPSGDACVDPDCTRAREVAAACLHDCAAAQPPPTEPRTPARGGAAQARARRRQQRAGHGWRGPRQCGGWREGGSTAATLAEGALARGGRASGRRTSGKGSSEAAPATMGPAACVAMAGAARRWPAVEGDLGEHVHWRWGTKVRPVDAEREAAHGGVTSSGHAGQGRRLERSRPGRKGWRGSVPRRMGAAGRRRLGGGGCRLGSPRPRPGRSRGRGTRPRRRAPAGRGRCPAEQVEEGARQADVAAEVARQ